MENTIPVSYKILDACNFAAKKHINQRRKDTGKTPYINHPIGVAFKLAECGVNDIDIIIAAVLHDIIEDTDTSKNEILEKFGPNVLNIVLECTDDKSLPKVQRKKFQIEHAKSISNQAKLVKLSDKYNNLSDIMDNPPITWSQTEKEGYIIWCYAVFINLKGINEILEKNFMELIDKLGIWKKYDLKKMDELLEFYYKHIDDPNSLD